MKKLGKELIFISRILGDGSGVVKKDDMSFEDNNTFELKSLSLTNETYIATDRTFFYVVKLKNTPTP